MAKKKYTDVEYLEFLNSELERINNSYDSSAAERAQLGIQEEFAKISELQSRPNEARRQSSDITGFGTGIDPRQPNPGGTLKLNPDGQGTFQGEPLAPTINFVSAPGEKKLTSKNNNAAIVLGSDRPSSLASGKGGKGAAHANTIDIVVGRMSCKQEQISKGKIKAVDPNFFCDASRIYVSQLTNVDLNFGIVAGVSGRADQMMGKPSAPRAAIGIKSDKVRVMGSEGVKIVTGRSYAAGGEEKNSLGGRIPRAAPIELIAGNVDGTRNVWGGLFNMPQKVQLLQGAVYGENLVDALVEIQESLDLVTGCVQRHQQLIGILTSILGITAPLEPWRAATAPIIAMLSKIFVGNALHHLRINKRLINIGFLSPAGAKYIVSQNVFLT